MQRKNCKARRQGDEIVCNKCGLRWEVKDVDPPKCNPPRSAKLILNNLRVKHA